MPRILSLIFTTLILLLPILISAQSTLKDQCVHKGVHVIVTSGYGSSNVNGYGLLGTLKDKILKQIPGSTAVSVTYSKGDMTKYASSMDSGTESTKRYIRQYVKSCPNSKIVLLGYSAGAMSTMNAVCGTSQDMFTPAKPIAAHYSNNIIATVVYGDHSHVSGLPYDVGTCKHRKGQFPRKKTACRHFANHIKSFCDTGDERCCPPDNGKDVHHSYQKYDNRAMNYIKHRWMHSTGRE